MPKTIAQHTAAYLASIGNQDLATLAEWLLDSYREAQYALIYECYGGKALDASLVELKEEVAVYRKRLAELAAQGDSLT